MISFLFENAMTVAQLLNLTWAANVAAIENIRTWTLKLHKSRQGRGYSCVVCQLDKEVQTQEMAGCISWPSQCK